MSRLRAALRRVIALVRPGVIDRDLDEEIAAHLAEAEEEYVRRGLLPSDARLAALRDFGGVMRTREHHRDVRSFGWIEDAWRDLHYGARLKPGGAGDERGERALRVNAAAPVEQVAFDANGNVAGDRVDVTEQDNRARGVLIAELTDGVAGVVHEGALEPGGAQLIDEPARRGGFLS